MPLRSLVICIGLCAACTEEASIVLIVDGDLSPGEDVDRLDVAVWAEGAQVWSERERVLSGKGGFSRTTRIPLVIEAGLAIELTAAAIHEGHEVVAASRSASFVRGQQIDVRVCLLRRCIGSGSEACRWGLCEGEGTDGDADGDADVEISRDAESARDADVEIRGDAAVDGGGYADAETDAEQDADAGSDAGADADMPEPAIIFVTSTVYGADIGGLSGADAECALRAAAGGLSGTFVPILSDSTGNAARRFAVEGLIHTSRDEFVAIGDYDLWRAALRHPIDTDELGNLVSPSCVWTGSDPNGSADSYRYTTYCDDWSSAAASGGVEIGRTEATDYRWISVSGVSDPSTQSCTATCRLYCIRTD